VTTEENKAVVRRYYEDVLNAGDLDSLDELALANYQEHDPLPGQTTGREGLRQRVEMLRRAFRPHFTIEDVIAEQDKVVVRWTNRGAQVGNSWGFRRRVNPSQLRGSIFIGCKTASWRNTGTSLINLVSCSSWASYRN
jgi:predicted SnoaL-like aldol condensation-catalyzing enzyme